MRHTLGLTIAAALLAFWPATAARAQFSYGRDSFIYGYQPSMSYYTGTGYTQMYTNPSNGVYAAGTTLAPQVAAPYNAPPFGSFAPGNGLPMVYVQPAQVVPRSAVVVTPVVKVRRPLARRLLRRQGGN